MPVDTNTTLKENDGKFSEPVPRGLYTCEILDIKNIKKVPYQAPAGTEATEDKILFTFAILNEGEYRARRLWREAFPVKPFEGRSIMREIVCAAYGKELSWEEANAFSVKELNALIGKQVEIMLDTKKGVRDPSKLYNKIVSFAPSANHFSPLTEDEKKTDDDKSGNPSPSGLAPATEAEPEEINVDDIPF